MAKKSVINKVAEGVVSNDAPTPKKTITKKPPVVNKEIEGIKKENESLKLQLQEILLALKGMGNTQEVVEDVSENVNTEDIYMEEISPSKQIRIMSLVNHTLILTTEPFGSGRIYKFSNYGEIKPILYSTLVDIVENQRSFAEEGKFYIMNDQAVYNIGLTEEYKKILSKDKIDKLLDLDDSSMSALFTSTTLKQKESIVDILVDKIVNNIYVDLNKIDILSKIYGSDIKKIAEEIISMQKILEKRDKSDS